MYNEDYKYLVTVRGKGSDLWGCFDLLQSAHEYIVELIEEDGIKDKDIFLYDLMERSFSVRTVVEG